MHRSSLVLGRFLVAFAIGLACSVAAPLSCHGQSSVATPERESLIHDRRSTEPMFPLDSGRDLAGLGRPDATSNIVASRPKFQRFLLPLGTALGYLGGTIDHDAGNYRDSFRFAPDKQAHALASTILAKAVADGTSVKLGFATCLLAGAAWEAGQARHRGYASIQDFVYDGAGCGIGALWGRK